MTRLGRLACLIVAAGGFAAAHVLVQPGNAMELQVPTVSVTVPTLPTVTTPTVPTPTVPTTPTVSVPSTPTVTAPPPAPTATVPTTPTPPPVVLPPPAPRPPAAPRPAEVTVTVSSTPSTSGSPAQPRSSAPSSTPVAARSSGASGSPSTGRSAGAGQSAGTGQRPTQSRSRRPRATPKPRTLEASVRKTRNRVSVKLAFGLPSADRIFLIVRGPAPSCRIAGYIPVRGRKGANNVFFAGRVQGRRLEPGVYMISISPNRRLVPGAPTEYVKVVSRRRSVPLPDNARKPSCNKPAALASDPTARLLIAEARLQPKADAQAKAKATAPIARPAAVPSVTTADEEEAAGAAGALPDAGVLGVATDDPDGNPIAAIAILTVVGALLIAMLALVTRFVRGSWNP